MVRLDHEQLHLRPEKPTNSAANRKGFHGGVVALSLVVGLMRARAENTPQTEAPAGSTNVQTDEVASNTEDYIGQTVTARSKPLATVGDGSFTVSDEQFFGHDPILVINISSPAHKVP